MTIEFLRKSCGAVLLAAAALAAPGCGQPGPADPALSAIGGAGNPTAAKMDEVAIGSDVSIEDAELTAKVRAAIVVEPALQTQHIDVDTQDAVVTLAGTVDSPELHDRVIRIAGSVDGVVEVRDKLDVGS